LESVDASPTTLVVQVQHFVGCVDVFVSMCGQNILNEMAFDLDIWHDGTS